MYDKQLTALLVIDPYNDFISEGGKRGFQTREGEMSLGRLLGELSGR